MQVGATRDDGWAERKSHKVDVISPGCPASRGHGNVIRQWCLVLRCGDVDRSCFPKPPSPPYNLQNVRASELVAPRKRMLSKVFTRASGCDLAAHVDLSDKNRTTPACPSEHWWSPDGKHSEDPSVFREVPEGMALLNHPGRVASRNIETSKLCSGIRLGQDMTKQQFLSVQLRIGSALPALFPALAVRTWMELPFWEVTWAGPARCLLCMPTVPMYCSMPRPRPQHGPCPK